MSRPVPVLVTDGHSNVALACVRSLGRAGVTDLVERLHQHAGGIAAGLAALDGAEVLNDVVYTQVCVAFGSDERTRAVTAQRSTISAQCSVSCDSRLSIGCS